MAQSYTGTIQTFACTFAPVNYAMCSGQIIGIAQNTALFSILGTNYGGNGTTTFALPNLMGCVPMHWGSPPGLSETVIGEMQGSPNVTLLVTEIPAHTHQAYSALQGAPAERTAAPKTDATSYIATSEPSSTYLPNATGLTSNFAPNVIGPTGSSQPHANQQPFLVMNICILLRGVFPSRN